MANRYFVCTRMRPPVEFDLTDEHPAEDAEITYFIRAFRALERDFGLDGYTVCFAWSATVALPKLGHDVIAVIYGEEHCRVPAYINAVHAVIHCHGPFPLFVPRRKPLRLAQIEAMEFLRNLALWVPNGWRWALSAKARARCHLIPIGYGISSDIAGLPFDERPYLMTFLGSVARPAGSIRGLIGTPKAYSRQRLVAVLQRLQQRYGKDNIPMRVSGGFQESIHGGGGDYFELMARTKLCVAPRGTTMETWRIYDGLRLGCIVIADHLPRHPFYRDTPIIQIEDWHDLPALVEELLADPGRMRDLHERSLKYWRDVLGDDAIVARCAKALGLTAVQRQRVQA